MGPNMSDEQHHTRPSTGAGAPGPEDAASDVEPMGGDPPCWAHLFGEDPGLAAEDLIEPMSPELSESPEPADGPGREPHHA